MKKLLSEYLALKVFIEENPIIEIIKTSYFIMHVVLKRSMIPMKA